METNNNLNLIGSQLIQFSIYKVDNQGDLSCGVKLLKMMHERLQIPLERFVILTNDPQGIRNFCGRWKIRIESLTVEQKQNVFLRAREGSSKTKQIENVALNIIVPACASVQVAKSLNFATKNLVLYEYGFQTAGWGFLPKEMFQEYSLGLNAENSDLEDDDLDLDTQNSHLGILIDSNWETQHKLTADDQALNRLMQLQSLPERLQDQILGDSKESIEERILQFSKKSLLFVSYSPAPLDFMKAIYEDRLQRSDAVAKNVVFVVPKLIQQSPNLNAEMASLAVEYRFKTVTLLHSDAEPVRYEYSEGYRDMTCLVDILPHEEFQAINAAGEPETVVTGDQSLGEAIFMNKQFVHVTPMHKMETGGKLNKLYSPLRPSVMDNRRCNFSARFKDSFKPEHRSFYSQINMKICREQDGYVAIQKIVLEMLAYPQVPPIRSLIEEEKFSVDLMEYDIPYLLNDDQMMCLKIDRSTKKSDLPELQGMHFIVRCIGPHWHVTKKYE